ncbi:hypothetical protein HHK36_009484 [Tetracentron sinense]|uniref:Uncharacterized protein n=1 Tax=Tetracentron sinense TaxID=13715 RepID=A0A835DL24_TETSI|nr:hypothetical protein HHK36_009484 [Tetracentron sinense]
MAVSPQEEGQDVYCISVVTDKGSTDPQCPSQLAFLNFLEVPYPSNSQMCLDASLNCKNCSDLQLESANAYSLCGVDIDIEKKILKNSKTDDKNVENEKTEGALTSPAFAEGGSENDQSTIMWEISATFTQSEPYITEVHFWRSSMGTMLLIYLTLRVKQIGDGFVHV